jgi:ferritin heavy chain
MSSKSRQNYHEESEALVNRQINVELNAYYQYLALVSWNQISQTLIKSVKS